MTKHTSVNNVSVKFECPSKLKTDFIACCEYFNISGAAAFRMVMTEWIELWRAKTEKKKK